MQILEHFQKLEALIIEHTSSPATTILRDQLALLCEQIEAYQVSSDKQDLTLSTQIETIERLMKENQILVSQIAVLKESHANSIAEIQSANANAMAELKAKHLKELTQDNEAKARKDAETWNKVAREIDEREFGMRTDCGDE